MRRLQRLTMITKKCKNCLKEFETRRRTKQHCSDECFSEYRNRPDVKEKTVNKRKLYNLGKYGVDNPSKSERVKEKAKKTCLDRYGEISPTLSKDVRDKQIATNLKKYGVENPQQNKEIQKRQQSTLFKNWGVTVPLKNVQIQERSKQSCMEKYGVDNPFKNPEIQRKQKNTCHDKYGVEYPMSNESVKRTNVRNRQINHYLNVICKSKKYNNIKPLFSVDEYNGNGSYNTHYQFKCLVCDSTFQDTMINGIIPRCIKCFPPKLFSLQNAVHSYITSILPVETEVQKNTRTVINPLELDIYIPSLRLAIEFNGIYYHSERGGKKNRYYHLNKTKRCEELGIKLIHIFEDEWIEKQEIIKSKIKHSLKLNVGSSVFSRKCIVKEITSEESNDFLERHHIQGGYNSPIRIGLFHKEKLVSVMTFGGLRSATGYKKRIDGVYEMFRFATSGTVCGSGGKLLKYFIKTYNPEKIISYADKRWSNESSFYSKLDFKLTKSTSPNYWYIDPNYTHRYHRFNFMKHLLKGKTKVFDSNLTEWENMQLNGYDRIWDCGNLKYELTINP
jgi:hypothetical protein